MKISKAARRDAKQLFRGCQVNGLLNEGRVREVVRKVAEAKPRGYLAILTHFHRLLKLELERRAARVDSAVPLPQELATGVTKSLTRVYGEGLSIAFTQNPALIGGLRVRVGSDVYDGSIQTQLERLEESF